MAGPSPPESTFQASTLQDAPYNVRRTFDAARRRLSVIGIALALGDSKAEAAALATGAVDGACSGLEFGYDL